VAPDGASLLVSAGQLNLAHRSSHLQPEALQPGQRYRVRLQLSACAHALPSGHHWRLALSPTYALMAWPSPVPVTLTVFTGADTWLRLPLRTAHPRDAALAPFEPAECAPPLAQSWLRPALHARTLQHDAAAGTYLLVDCTDEGRVLQTRSGLLTDEVCTERFEITEGDPLSARRTTEWRMEFARGAWQTRIETQSALTSDATHFHASNTLQAFEGGQSVFRKQWNFSVARDCM
ncbi:MAG: peptidase S15, partial [Chloroflexi bacterium]|nr:peptidase S15 [Chloroflexota bacterium]